MKDPKFGYHWLWMLPIALLIEAYSKICDFYRSVRMKLIIKNNPEIRELTKLSGIKNE